jgi:3(or 17)beta-hydroxysteroid dehydrogenase
MTARRVEGKIAVVSGAASGIGAATARLLAAAGARVGLADIDAEGVQTVLSEIRTAGGEGTALRLDTTIERDWIDEIDAICARWGGLDVAVNCAGVGLGRTMPSETPLEGWRQVIAINLDGVFLGTKHALRAMQRREPPRGSIINISSIMGMVALPDVAAYNASKGGVRLYTKSVALSCAERGFDIRVNSVHPGFIDTPMIRRSMARFDDLEAARRRYDSLQPVGRLGRPEDIAYGVLYLASDEARFVTGSELVIDGGYSVR